MSQSVHVFLGSLHYSDFSLCRYEKHSTVHGIPQPAGLQRCQAFPEGPIYTVSLLQVGIAPPESISGEIPLYVTPQHFFAGKTDN